MDTLIQEGLVQKRVVGRYTTYSEIYSIENYCFYDTTQEIYDEEGNVIPEAEVKPEQRQYMRYCSTPLVDIEEINKIYKSVEIQPDFEIV